MTQSVADLGLAEGAGPAEEIPVDEIRPNPFQPRQGIAKEALAELVASIREHGLLQPIVVRNAPDGEGYELIAGERRWRACQEAGLDTAPAMVRDVSDDDALTLALVENIQREDLNPVEKARGFQDMSDRFGLTQEEISKRTGKSRSDVANFVRLLELPETVLELLSQGAISMGHAKALMSLRPARKQVQACERIVRRGLSVRDTEGLVSARKTEPPAKGKPEEPKKSVYFRHMEDAMRERIGLKVALDAKGRKGKLTVFFSNDTEFQQLLDALGMERYLDL